MRGSICYSQNLGPTSAWTHSPAQFRVRLAMTKGPELELGQIVAGKYRLLDVLGEGGMGVVYLAENELIEKKIALKILRKEYSGKAELVQRFKQEAISASRIKHPNVLDVFDFGQLENGCFFLAMEHLQGCDLAQELTQSTVIEPVTAVRLALQMCRALGAAHSRGVVHRDMKPENVFLHRTEDGDEIVKIVDFGIAQLRARDDQTQEQAPRRRLTRTGVIFGTPEYMSPEQAAGRNADLRVDIYAVGVILYEMFTGAVPFAGESFMAVLTAHLTQAVPPMRSWAPSLDISAELESAVMKSLAKNPDERYQSMSELGWALQQTPEGRSAVPLAALLPIPQVTHDTFRPARGAAAVTAPHFSLEPAARKRTSASRIEVQSDPFAMGSETTIADTQGIAASPVELAKQSRRRIWPLTLLSVTFLLGGVSFVLFTAHRRHEGLVSTTSPTTPVAVATPVPAASNPVAVEARTPLTAQQVTLTASTEPPGAILFKDGFQVCDSTPCTLTVNAREAMVLEGRKGSFKGILKVLAQRDQSVNIVLIPAPSMVRRPAKSSSAQFKLCEVVVDGLKILRPCSP
jgi:serine/threonine protein kinase